jgi:hypothetical protein
MITAALIFVLIVTIAGLVAIERAVRNARPGYEDETGFHFETDSAAPVVVQKRVAVAHKIRPARRLTHAT